MPKIDIRLSKDYYQEVKERADEFGITKEQVIKNSLDAYLSEEVENPSVLIGKKDNEIEFLKDHLESKNNEMETKINSIKVRLRSKDNRINSLEDKIEILEKKVEDKEDQIRDKERLINEKDKRINNLKKRNQELIKELKETVLLKEDLKGINKVFWWIIKALIRLMGIKKEKIEKSSQ